MQNLRNIACGKSLLSKYFCRSYFASSVVGAETNFTVGKDKPNIVGGFVLPRSCGQEFQHLAAK